MDTDTRYQGIAKLHAKPSLPRKKTKKNPLTKEDKAFNRAISSERVLDENVIASSGLLSALTLLLLFTTLICFVEVWKEVYYERRFLKSV